MKQRSLGAIEVSEIGMGCMGFSHGYGAIPNEEYSIEAIRGAFDYGCTFFDTAEGYGPNLLPENHGHNERLLGRALADVRGKAVIATKLHVDAEDVAREGIDAVLHRHLEASLANLQTDHVELYYLHRVNPAVPIEDVAAGMGRLIDEGLIGGWGLSQVDVDTISRAHEVTPVSAVQNIYSMVERGIEDKVIPYCQQHGIGIVPFSPIASGLLSGKVTAATKFAESDDVRKFVPQLAPENLAANQPLIDLLAEFAQEKNATSAQISLAWMLRKHQNVVPIPGSKNKGRIMENLRASEVELSDDEFARLEQALDAIEVHGHRGFDEAEGRSFLDK